MRRTLFDDPFLCPILTFISPSGRGVKAFVPYSKLYADDQTRNVKESINWAMQYIEITYGAEMNDSTETPPKAVDTSGKDIVRAVSSATTHKHYSESIEQSILNNQQ